MLPAQNLEFPGRKPGHVIYRNRYFAWRFNYRVLLFALLALLATVAIALWAMTLGSADISVRDVASAMFGNGTEDENYVVRSLRAPRVLSAILIGASLSISGAIFQGLVRNPLVSPDVIGIDAGASAVAVAWIVSSFSNSLLPLAAFGGAMGAAALIYVLSWKGGISPDRLILVGIGIGAALAAITTFVIVKFPTQLARPAQVWTLGSIYGSTWEDVRWLAITLLAGGSLAIALMWPLRALQLGDEISRGLGMPLERTRLSLIAIGCALAAVSVAIAGPIGFVALMVPHVGRMLAGPLSGSVLVFIATIGALFLLSADVIAQHFLPATLPVGVITAAVGAPYFLFLLYRSSVRQ
jgi:iron complex transport system permease protein